MLAQLSIIITTYIITSLWETFVHWKILHSNRKVRQLWKKMGILGQLPRCAYFSHNIIHHNNTFRESYFLQFANSGEQAKLNNRLPEKLRAQIIHNKYGLTISSFWELFTFMAFPLIFNTWLFFKCAHPITLTLIPLISITPALLSKYIHPSLHEIETVETKNYSLWVKYKKFIAKYHKIHHEVGLKNFNLLPGGDFIIGVYQLTNSRGKDAG